MLDKIRNQIKANTTEPGKLQPEDVRDIKEVRPFFWLLLAVLAFLYVISVKDSPYLKASPVRLTFFTVLMLVHAILHWVSPYVVVRQKWLPVYFIVQGLLAFFLTWLGGSMGLLMGLYTALAGETLGILSDFFRSAFVIAGYILLGIINISLMWGWGEVALWMGMAIPMLVFTAIYVRMYLRQLEARSRAQALLEELEIAHKQLAEYAWQVEELTLAGERQRMARELHDTLAQGLAGLILQLEAVDSHLARGNSERAQAIVQQAMSRARGTLTDARRAIDDLRQSPAASSDILEAVREEVERFRNVTGITCFLEIDPLPKLNENLGENTLRAVREGLANIARHARAHKVWIEITIREANLVLEIRDDGIGFDPDSVIGKQGHYGLLGLQERARLAGGTFHVSSSLESGTILRFSLPLTVEVLSEMG